MLVGAFFGRHVLRRSFELCSDMRIMEGCNDAGSDSSFSGGTDAAECLRLDGSDHPPGWSTRACKRFASCAGASSPRPATSRSCLQPEKTWKAFSSARDTSLRLGARVFFGAVLHTVKRPLGLRPDGAKCHSQAQENPISPSNCAKCTMPESVSFWRARGTYGLEERLDSNMFN